MKGYSLSCREIGVDFRLMLIEGAKVGQGNWPFTQQIMSGFLRNFQDSSAMRQGTID